LTIVTCKKDKPSTGGGGVGGHKLVVKVVDENGTAVAEALVKSGNGKATTDASGNATINGAKVEDGKVKISVEKTGYFTGYRNVMVETEGSADINASITLMEKKLIGTVKASYAGTLEPPGQNFKMGLNGQGFTTESGAAYDGSVSV